MSILIDKSTRLIVQGITGRDGLFHARKMKEYGIQCSDYAIRIGIKQAFRLIDQTDFLRFILASYHKESQGS